MKWRRVEFRTEKEARESLEQARKALEAARERRAEAERQAGQMRAYRLENHLAEQFRLAMGGKP